MNNLSMNNYILNNSLCLSKKCICPGMSARPCINILTFMYYMNKGIKLDFILSYDVYENKQELLSITKSWLKLVVEINLYRRIPFSEALANSGLFFS